MNDASGLCYELELLNMKTHITNRYISLNQIRNIREACIFNIMSYKHE